MVHPTPYPQQDWKDHIVDTSLPENDPKRIIQEGTRFTGTRMNNIEGNILEAYKGIDGLKDENVRLKIQIEMVGRAPINNGTFFDPFDINGAKQLALLTSSAVLQNATIAGVTTITLDNTPFLAGEEVTIYDEEKSESVKITNILGKVLTVPALVNPYKKGAKVARSNAIIKDEKLTYGSWGAYSISVKEVI